MLKNVKLKMLISFLLLTSYAMASKIEKGDNAKAGENSIAIGDKADATGTKTVGIGNEAVAKGDRNIAIGYKATTKYGSTNSAAIGTEAEVEKDSQNAFAIGKSAKIKKDASSAYALGAFSEIGELSRSSYTLGTRAKIMNNVEGAYALGQNAEINESSSHAYAIGQNTKIARQSPGSYALGREASVGFYNSTTNRAGNGDDFNSHTTAVASYALGDNSAVAGSYAYGIGYRARIGYLSDSSYTMGSNAEIGYGSKKSYSIGYKSKIHNGIEGSYAIGEESEIEGLNSKHSYVLGYKSKIGEKNKKTENSYLLGNNSTLTASNSVVFGSNIKADQDNSVYLGNDSKYVAKSDTTLGLNEYQLEEIQKLFKGQTFAGTKTNGIFTVGDVGKERRLQNVAAGLIGEKSTDAVNGSQLYALYKTLENKIASIPNNGGGSGSNPPANPNLEDKVNKNASAIEELNKNTVKYENDSKDKIKLAGTNGTRISNVKKAENDDEAVNLAQLKEYTQNMPNSEAKFKEIENKFKGIDNKFEEVDKKIENSNKMLSAGIALSNAMASIPSVGDNKYVSIGIGTSYYNKQGGFALGISGTEPTKTMRYKVAFGIDTQKHFAFSTGINVSFVPVTKSVSIKNNMAEEYLRKENMEMKKTISNLENENNKINKKLEDLEKMIKDLLEKKKK